MSNVKQVYAPLLAGAVGVGMIVAGAMVVSPAPPSAEQSPPLASVAESISPGDPMWSGVIERVEGSHLPGYEGVGKDPAIGEASPVITVAASTGETITIGGGGKPQIVFMFSPSCPHCQAIAPVVSRWLRDVGDKADVIGVAEDTTFLREAQWKGGLITDKTGQVANAYALAYVPAAVVLDRQGKVVQRYSYGVTPDSLDTMVDGLQ